MINTIRFTFLSSCLFFIHGCLVINPTYSDLSTDEKAKIHIEAFNSKASMPVAPANANDVVLKEINYEQLDGLIKQSSKKLKWVLFYTAMCHGTPLIMPYVKEMKEKYGNDIDIFLLASDDYATSNSVKKKLFEYGITFQTYIINNSYGEFKDNRKKGFIVRKLLCEKCREDQIGVPYNVVLDHNNAVVFKKYRSYTQEGDKLVGDDFIGKLYQQNN